ncbi:hypothetical protein [Streptomyces sp. NPDC059262]|uniref:hypothetical protein n=1 Tax=Streptomyces sp. NPDC059262 TaxID=3346797 RepID=UPI0036CCB7C7
MAPVHTPPVFVRVLGGFRVERDGRPSPTMPGSGPGARRLLKALAKLAPATGASADVALAVAANGTPTGTCSDALTATPADGGQALRVPLRLDRAQTITVKAMDRDGNATPAQVTLLNADNGAGGSVTDGAGGSLALRVPDGDYLGLADISMKVDGVPAVAVVSADLHAGDKKIVFDARTARRWTASVEGNAAGGDADAATPVRLLNASLDASLDDLNRAGRPHPGGRRDAVRRRRRAAFGQGLGDVGRRQHLGEDADATRPERSLPPHCAALRAPVSGGFLGVRLSAEDGAGNTVDTALLGPFPWPDPMDRPGGLHARRAVLLLSPARSITFRPGRTARKVSARPGLGRAPGAFLNRW